MPKSTPTLSYTHIRDYAERYTWIDPVTGERQIGYDPPPNAVNSQPVPFNITYLTTMGVPHRGRVVCTSVDVENHNRNIKYLESGEVRTVSDALIISIDGVRFITH